MFWTEQTKNPLTRVESLSLYLYFNCYLAEGAVAVSKAVEVVLIPPHPLFVRMLLQILSFSYQLTTTLPYNTDNNPPL